MKKTHIDQSVKPEKTRAEGKEMSIWDAYEALVILEDRLDLSDLFIVCLDDDREYKQLDDEQRDRFYSAITKTLGILRQVIIDSGTR